MIEPSLFERIGRASILVFFSLLFIFCADFSSYIPTIKPIWVLAIVSTCGLISIYVEIMRDQYSIQEMMGVRTYASPLELKKLNHLSRWFRAFMVSMPSWFVVAFMIALGALPDIGFSYQIFFVIIVTILNVLIESWRDREYLLRLNQHRKKA